MVVKLSSNVSNVFLKVLKLSSEVSECKPLMRGRPTLWLPGTDHAGIATQLVVERALEAEGQGLTLVHFSAQRKRFLWDRGCVQGVYRGCLRVVAGC
jgi:hypothetical protein